MSDARRNDIIADIEVERDRQDEQWGGTEHDDTHAAIEWIEQIRKQCVLMTLSPETTRGRFVKIAALAVAAIESLDRRSASDRKGAHE